MQTQKPKQNFFDKERFLTLCIQDDTGLTLPDISSSCKLLIGDSHSFSLINGYGDPVSSSQIEGIFTEIIPNTFSVVFCNVDDTFLYLGKNQYSAEVIPTIKSYNEEDENDKLEHCIAWVQREDFLQAFWDSPYPKRVMRFEVLGTRFEFDSDAIALHCDFISNCVEVTKNLMVALFNAYTYKDDAGNYKPIDDFSKFSPTLYISDIAKIQSFSPGCLELIGFQMLPHSLVRKTMALKVKDEKVIEKAFDKYELPKSYAVACDVFDKFSKSIGLNPPHDSMESAAAQIRKDGLLNYEHLESYCNLKGYDLTKMIQKVHDKGYKSTSSPLIFSQGDCHRMNAEIDGFVQYLRTKIGIIKTPKSK